MTETYHEGIDHPNQSWWSDHSLDVIDEDHRIAIEERFKDVPDDAVLVSDLLVALRMSRDSSYSQRSTHEHVVRGLLGMQGYGIDPVHAERLWKPYNGYTGHPEKIGHFIKWISHVFHEAFVAQENGPAIFDHLAMDLGGKGNVGDWNATVAFDEMVNNIPSKVLDAAPRAEITVYGQNDEFHLCDSRVRYRGEASKSYLLRPLPVGNFHIPTLENPGKLVFDYALVRRRRPLADINIPYEAEEDEVTAKEEQEVITENVLFKEGTGLLVMGAVDKDLGDAILEDCNKVFRRHVSSQDADLDRHMVFKETRGAKIAGLIFEIAIKSGYGETKNIVPVEAHMVQGVGDKFSEFRKRLA
jgi:hypothetical protein